MDLNVLRHAPADVPPRKHIVPIVQEAVGPNSRSLFDVTFQYIARMTA